mmetsp:Transcript_73522/g.208287  ORF Transcript_73522/g.208287 Transcript_73522/m.208287 type:complete len:297 (+) Transcript_73522:353-1243(+)
MACAMVRSGSWFTSALRGHGKASGGAPVAHAREGRCGHSRPPWSTPWPASSCSSRSLARRSGWRSCLAALASRSESRGLTDRGPGSPSRRGCRTERPWTWRWPGCARARRATSGCSHRQRSGGCSTQCRWSKHVPEPGCGQMGVVSGRKQAVGSIWMLRPAAKADGSRGGRRGWIGAALHSMTGPRFESRRTGAGSGTVHPPTWCGAGELWREAHGSFGTAVGCAGQEDMNGVVFMWCRVARAALAVRPARAAPRSSERRRASSACAGSWRGSAPRACREAHGSLAQQWAVQGKSA